MCLAIARLAFCLLWAVIGMECRTTSFFAQTPMSRSRVVRRDVAQGAAVDADAVTMASWHVSTHVSHRYAKTSLETRLRNPSGVAKEMSFSAVLPQEAFISAFHIEMHGQVYHAYVKEKEEAQRDYNTARSHGQSTAIVIKARDSNVFTASVNVEAMSKVTFNLTYEELLSRKLGLYHHVINIDPQQIVADMSISVRIEDSSALRNITVPPLRVSNEIDATDGAGDVAGPASIARPTPNVAVITWAPTPDEQRDLRSEGVRGQLVVQYDVVRDGNPAQILVSDGYFVHFYAPADLAPLRKHAVFVLDVSGSMDGSKMAQLKQAMGAVLADLQPDDAFSIVTFESSVRIWTPQGHPLLGTRTYYAEASLPAESVVDATAENVMLAKAFVNQLDSLGGTNIFDALVTALDVVKLGRRTLSSSKEGGNPEPLIFFLTDGEANEGTYTGADDIVREVTAKNKRRVPVFCLAFGRGTDLAFLKRLALSNAAFAKLIYEAGDAALQLRDFYRQLASPLLANVTFNYEPTQVSSLTSVEHNTLFAGNEIVVAGKLLQGDGESYEKLRGSVKAKSSTGRTQYDFPESLSMLPPSDAPAPGANQSASFVERLWAYLTIQQLLQDQERAPDNARNSTVRARALELALKYSFVTSLTSLVVVKPNDTRTASDPTVVDADQTSTPSSWQPSTSLHLRVAQRRPAAIMHSYPMTFNYAAGQAASSGYGGGAPAPRFNSYPVSYKYAGPVAVSGYGSYSQDFLEGSSTPPPVEVDYEEDEEMEPPPPPPPTRAAHSEDNREMAFIDSSNPGSFQILAREPPTTLPAPSPSTTTPPPAASQLAVTAADAVRVTTAVSAVQATPRRLTVADISWAVELKNDTHVSITDVSNGALRTTAYRIGLGQPNVDTGVCPSYGPGTSVCRHLAHCVLPDFKDDFSKYVSIYFCPMQVQTPQGQSEWFAGACCPLAHQSQPDYAPFDL